MVMMSKALSLMEFEQSAARRVAFADTLSRLVETVHPVDFGPTLINGIAALLEDDEKQVRRAAAHALAHVGPCLVRGETSSFPHQSDEIVS